MYDLCEDSAWALFPTIKLDRLDPATYEQSRNMNMRIGTWLREMSGRQNVQTVFFLPYLNSLSFVKIFEIYCRDPSCSPICDSAFCSVCSPQASRFILHSSHEVSHSISIPWCWNAILCSAGHCLWARFPPILPKGFTKLCCLHT